MANDTQRLVDEAQKRGVTMTEADDGSWHGSFIHDAQEYTLDADNVEALSDDMTALVDILTQDDTYSIDYNEDADRYILSVVGIEEPFADRVLARAYAKAKDALDSKMRKQEEERKATAKPAEPAPVRTRKPKTNGDPLQAQGSAVAMGDLPLPISDAIVRLINALTDLVQGANHKQRGQSPTNEPEPFIPEPPKRKRGLSKA